MTIHSHVLCRHEVELGISYSASLTVQYILFSWMYSVSASQYPTWLTVILVSAILVSGNEETVAGGIRRAPYGKHI